MSDLTHLDETGAARMVDVGGKPATAREALAEGRITMAAATVAAIRAGALAKGDVLAVARVAGIMAAKKTSELIPLCHPLPLSKVEIELAIEDYGVVATATCATDAKTGVEMEALTAVSITLLALYDMAKAVQKDMAIGPIRLVRKTGGKSGDWSA